jgi:mRNA interferase RelE/StbE
LSWQVRWLPTAVKDLSRLDSQNQDRILTVVDRYAASGHGDIKRLTDVDPPEWRLRVGKWRVRFRRNDAQRTMEILRVLLRDQAY